jgi:hypothetical protein
MRFGKFHGLMLITLGVLLVLLQPLLSRVSTTQPTAATSATTSSPSILLVETHHFPFAGVLGGLFILAGGLIYVAVRNKSEYQPGIQVK